MSVNKDFAGRNARYQYHPCWGVTDLSFKCNNVVCNCLTKSYRLRIALLVRPVGSSFIFCATVTRSKPMKAPDSFLFAAGFCGCRTVFGWFWFVFGRFSRDALLVNCWCFWADWMWWGTVLIRRQVLGSIDGSSLSISSSSEAAKAKVPGALMASVVAFMAAMVFTEMRTIIKINYLRNNYEHNHWKMILIGTLKWILQSLLAASN